MRKLTLIMIFFMSTNAFAKWTMAGSSDEFTLYVDLQSIRKKGNRAKIWYLIDNKSVGYAKNKIFLSERGLNEFDCEDESGRRLAFSSHSEHMGQGEIVTDDNNKGKFEAVPPESAMLTIFKTACGKYF